MDASFSRAAEYGDGWIMGGGSPDDFRAGLTKLTDAWETAGREGLPRKAALGYFSLGDEARRNADDYLNDYYGWLGDDIAGYIAGSAPVDDDAVVEYVAEFEDAGCDELILFPCSSEPEQVDLLARAVGMGAPSASG